MSKTKPTRQLKRSSELECDFDFLELLTNFEDPYKASEIILAIEHKRVRHLLGGYVAKLVPEKYQGSVTSYIWIAEIADEVVRTIRSAVIHRCISPLGVLADWSVASHKDRDPKRQFRADAAISGLRHDLLATSHSHDYRFHRSMQQCPRDQRALASSIARLEQDRIFEYIDSAVWALAEIPGCCHQP